MSAEISPNATGIATRGWSVTQLDSPPVSGDVPEKHFDGGEGRDWRWFSFEYRGERCWVCSMRVGYDRHNHVVETGKDGLLFVVAGGQGYWVNAESQDGTCVRLFSNLNGVISVPGSDSVIVATDTNLYRLSPTSRLWKSSRISWDGIQLDRCDGAIVYGKGWNLNDWTEIQASVDAGLVIKSAYLGQGDIPISSPPTSGYRAIALPFALWLIHGLAWTLAVEFHIITPRPLMMLLVSIVQVGIMIWMYIAYQRARPNRDPLR